MVVFLLVLHTNSNLDIYVEVSLLIFNRLFFFERIVILLCSFRAGFTYKNNATPTGLLNGLEDIASTDRYPLQGCLTFAEYRIFIIVEWKCVKDFISN